ncbi:HpcH/HpaI aldolase family protein [Radicibacter daui]|uniref:HpcH/HpaI aldolase family protein n=1 Tax=Radicibacter daui TaxID=3064829 RepID=UPI004046B9A3
MLELAARLKRGLREGRLSVGSWLMTRDPICAEVLARSGLDWVCVDMEHAPISLSEAADLIRVAGNCGCPALVRLPDHGTTLVKQVLDAGAAGVIVPDIRTAEQAARIGESARYPSATGGTRGVGLARAQGYGRDFFEYANGWNEAAIVIAQIEHVDGVANVEAILAQGAVDAVFIGPYDLSASMGLAGQLDHPDMVAAVERVITAAAKAGKPAGGHAVPVDPARAVAMINRGMRLLAYASDVFMIRQAVDDFVSAIDTALPGARNVHVAADQ